MIDELDVVELSHDIEDHGLKRGDIGVVVHVYKNQEAYEVEFVTGENGMSSVLTLTRNDIRLRNEFWGNLCRKVFTGRGRLSRGRVGEEWDCEFVIAQLLNGRVLVQIRGLTHSAYGRLYNLISRVNAFSLTGELRKGQKVEATGINLSWAGMSFEDGDYLEGYVLLPGYIEIKHQNYIEEVSSKIIYEVTNLSIGLQHKVEAKVPGGKIKLQWLPQSNQVLRYAKGLKSSSVRSQINIEFDPTPSDVEPDDLIYLLCNLLSLAQRSTVHQVAAHWQNGDGTIVRSLFQEPVFDYPPASRPLIPAEALGNFLETTVEEFIKQWDVWKLSWAINYYVQSMALKDILSQSIGFFTTLETLKNAFLKQSGKSELEYYVKSGQFRKKNISQRVINILNEEFAEFQEIFITDKDPNLEKEKKVEREKIKSKVGELNRRAYKLVLKEMFKDLGVIVDDEVLDLLVALRNRIIHQGVPDYEKDPNMSQTASTVSRFSSLVERTILAILKYEGDYERYDQSLQIVDE